MSATRARSIANLHDVITDTKMTSGGLKDDTQRADLIAYLGTLH